MAARKTPTDVTIAPSNPGLACEVSSLDEIRQALASGRAEASLRLLDAHEQRFTHPRLGPEAQLLRVETLVALGRNDAANVVGARLLATQTSSAYGQRARSLLKGATSTNQ
jgi:hypothetical protein